MSKPPSLILTLGEARDVVADRFACELGEAEEWIEENWKLGRLRILNKDNFRVCFEHDCDSRYHQSLDFKKREAVWTHEDPHFSHLNSACEIRVRAVDLKQLLDDLAEYIPRCLPVSAEPTARKLAKRFPLNADKPSFNKEVFDVLLQMKAEGINISGKGIIDKVMNRLSPEIAEIAQTETVARYIRYFRSAQGNTKRRKP